VLRTDTPLFAELVEARRNRRDEWYKHMAGHIDLCNVPLPTRAPPPKPVVEKAKPKPKAKKKAKSARSSAAKPATTSR